jgi:hypothetical protein
MHAFALLLGSIMAHDHLRTVVSRAQSIVTYFRAAHLPFQRLKEARAALHIGGRMLESSNKTRLTSTVMMLASVIHNEAAIKAVAGMTLEQQGNRRGSIPLIKSAEVRDIIADDTFWQQARLLHKLVKPFETIIMATQNRHATLADVTRYWIYLARILEDALQDQSTGEMRIQLWEVHQSGASTVLVLFQMLVFMCTAVHFWKRCVPA